MRTDYLRQFYAPRIDSIKAASSDFGDFKSWVSSSKYQLLSSSSDGFIIRTQDETAFASMLASDASRFASASFETMKIISFPEVLPRSIGWVVVETYYAAFFAAHSVLRVFGNSFSFLERGHLRILQEISNLISIPWNYQKGSGSFVAKYDVAKKELNVSKAGNSHEDFWAEFYRLIYFLRDAVNRVDGLQTVKKSLTVSFGELLDGISNNNRDGKGAWLSTIRNSVNYQHSDGLWFPYSRAVHDLDKIKRIIPKWDAENIDEITNINPSTIIEKFFKVCLLVINLSYSLCSDLVSLSKDNKSCFCNIPNKVISVANGRA